MIYLIIGIVIGAAICFIIFDIQRKNGTLDFGTEHGVVEVDYSDENAPKALMLFTIPVDDLRKYEDKQLIFRVKDVTNIVKKKMSQQNHIV